MSTAYQGTFSYDKYTLLAPDVIGIGTETSRQKRYKMLFQKGKSLTDPELMDIQHIEDSPIRQLIHANYPDGSTINNGFKIIESPFNTSNNFGILGGDATVNGAGLLFVDGYILYIKTQYDFEIQSSSADKNADFFTNSSIFVYTDDGLGNITPKGGVATYSTPVGLRTDIVFVDFYFAEVASKSGSEYEDTDLICPGINVPTAYRAKQVQDICVIENGTTLPGTAIISNYYHYEVDANGIYHRYVRLATIDRQPGDPAVTTSIITDDRIVINNAYSYMNAQAENVFIGGPMGIGTTEIANGTPTLFVYGGTSNSINRVGITTDINDSVRAYGTGSFGSQGSIFFGDDAYVFITEYKDDNLLISAAERLILDGQNYGVGIGTSEPQCGSGGLHVSGVTLFDTSVGIGTTSLFSDVSIFGKSVLIAGAGTKVGIGTTDFDNVTEYPGAKFLVYDDGIQQNAVFVSTGGTSLTAVGFSTGAIGITASADQPTSQAIQISGTNGAYAIVVTGGTSYFADPIGIGITNPTGQFHVVGNSWFESSKVGIGTTNFDNTGSGWLGAKFLVFGNNDSNAVFLTKSGNALLAQGDNAGSVAIGATVYGNASYGVYITAAGVGSYSVYAASGNAYFADNVGIGTTNPLGDLDLRGNAYFNNGIVGIGTTSFDNSPSGYDGARILVKGTTAENAVFEATTGIAAHAVTSGIGAYGFYSVSAGNNACAFYGDAAGNGYGIFINDGISYFADNVGVGTTDPQVSMHVSGAIREHNRTYNLGEWTTYNNFTITPDTGTFSYAARLGRYSVIGKTIIFQFSITYTVTSGTPTVMTVTLPIAMTGAFQCSFYVFAEDTVATDAKATITTGNDLVLQVAPNFSAGPWDLEGSVTYAIA